VGDRLTALPEARRAAAGLTPARPAGWNRLHAL
jgi:hypothetical protein